MAEANNTLDETIALGTAATEITRDAASVGNAMKTISMRIRGYDETTNEYVGGVEVLDGAIANLTKTAKNGFSGVSLFADKAKTEFKSTTQIMRDIAEIYNDLDDKTQARLLEKLAGEIYSRLPDYAEMYNKNIFNCIDYLKPCTTITEKSRYERLTTQGYYNG